MGGSLTGCCYCTTPTNIAGCPADTSDECVVYMCQNTVDPTCCNVEWHAGCAAEAVVQCGNGTTTTMTPTTSSPTTTAITTTSKPMTTSAIATSSKPITTSAITTTSNPITTSAIATSSKPITTSIITSTATIPSASTTMSATTTRASTTTADPTTTTSTTTASTPTTSSLTTMRYDSDDSDDSGDSGYSAIGDYQSYDFSDSSGAAFAFNANQNMDGANLANQIDVNRYKVDIDLDFVALSFIIGVFSLFTLIFWCYIYRGQKSKARIRNRNATENKRNVYSVNDIQTVF